MGVGQSHCCCSDSNSNEVNSGAPSNGNAKYPHAHGGGVDGEWGEGGYDENGEAHVGRVSGSALRGVHSTVGAQKSGAKLRPSVGTRGVLVALALALELTSGVARRSHRAPAPGSRTAPKSDADAHGMRRNSEP